MKEYNDFQEIGKKMPYQAPDGFFDQVSGLTLQKAKQREQHHRKILVLWRTVAVAASLAVIAMLGFYHQDKTLKPDATQIVQNNQQPLQENKAAKLPEIADTNKVAADKTPEKADVEENANEVVNDVLADLNDDELLQLAAMYKTDPFMDDQSQ